VSGSTYRGGGTKSVAGKGLEIGGHQGVLELREAAGVLRFLGCRKEEKSLRSGISLRVKNPCWTGAVICSSALKKRFVTRRV